MKAVIGSALITLLSREVLAQGFGDGSEGKASAVVFPSRMSRCGGRRGGWSAIKLASVILDEESQIEGVSAVLDAQTWSLINNLPITDEAIPWPGVCPSLDDFVENLLQVVVSGGIGGGGMGAAVGGGAAAGLGAGAGLEGVDPGVEQGVDALVEFFDGRVDFFDGDKLGLSYDRLARRYAGAALVSPHALLIPACLNFHPGANHARANAQLGISAGTDFRQVFSTLSKILGSDKMCVSCVRRLILDIGELVTGAPVDPAIAERVLEAFRGVEDQIQANLREFLENGDLAHPTDFLKVIIPPVIQIVKDSVGDGKEEALLEFLATVRSEMKTSGATPIERRMNQFFHTIGC